MTKICTLKCPNLSLISITFVVFFCLRWVSINDNLKSFPDIIMKIIDDLRYVPILESKYIYTYLLYNINTYPGEFFKLLFFLIFQIPSMKRKYNNYLITM